MSDHIVRSVCLFTDKPEENCITKLKRIESQLKNINYIVQTLRLCSPSDDLYHFIENADPTILYAVGSLTLRQARDKFNILMGQYNISFNIDLTQIEPAHEHVDFLFEIIRINPKKCFNFTYVINNAPSSPYFPSSAYKKNGFSIGLQPTNLSINCQTIDQWLTVMQKSWLAISQLFSKDNNFLGIDSSIAPLLDGAGSLINFLERIGVDFNHSVVSPMYTQMTHFIKNKNPKSVGLCGLMMPCLEDFELTDQYSKGNFSIERNIFLSLHSGLGIDTYPIGIDEDKEIILNILKLLRSLSLKYNKPLSARFVSDGKAKIGEKTDLQSPYLKDIIVKPLIFV